MKKDATICFRTGREIKRALDKLAEEQRQSVSAVIENIIYDHLKQTRAIERVNRERRKFSRKPVSLPAFIVGADAGPKELKAGKILDISLGGLHLSISRSAALGMKEADNAFEIVFTLPEATQPIRMCCKSNHLFESGDEVHFGASFVDSDFQSYQTLQEYLI